MPKPPPTTHTWKGNIIIFMYKFMCYVVTYHRVRQEFSPSLHQMVRLDFLHLFTKRENGIIWHRAANDLTP